MTKKTLLAAALALAACVPAETDPAQKFRDVLPKAEAVQVGTPQDEAPAGALAVRRDALGDTAMLQSEYAVMSYYLALSVNGGAGLMLGVLQFIVAHPPTTYDDTSATWGPWVDEQGNNFWKLDVEKVGEDYAYVLSAQNGETLGDFVTVLSGVATPGADRDHGSGNFTIFFDAEELLFHGPLYVRDDFGQLTITYDNTQNVSVTAVFTGGHKDDGDQDPTNDHVMDAAYSFQDAASGGELQVAFADLTSDETVALRTRWSAGGAGRSDVHYTPPGGTPVYSASECWAGHAQDFAEVYDSKHTEIPELADENACSPFSTPSYADIPLP